MSRKTHDPEARPADATVEPDTSSLEQRVGESEPKDRPERRLPKMPHERDESARGTGERLREDPVPSRREIEQAVEDVEAGRVDTDRGIPDDVPGSRRNREP